MAASTNPAPTKEQLEEMYADTQASEAEIINQITSIVNEFKASWKSIIENLPAGMEKSIAGQYLARLQTSVANSMGLDLENIRKLYSLPDPS